MKPISQIDFSCHCPACGAKHTKQDLDGGRCHSCFDSLCGVTEGELRSFLVNTKRQSVLVKAENPTHVRKTLDNLGYTVESIIEITAGKVISGLKQRHCPFEQTLGREIVAHGFGVVDSSNGLEPCTYLFFSGGTYHGFVHPGDNWDPDVLVEWGGEVDGEQYEDEDQ